MALFMLVVPAVARSGVSVGEAGLLSDLLPRGLRGVSTLVRGSSGSLLHQYHVLRRPHCRCALFLVKVCYVSDVVRGTELQNVLSKELVVSVAGKATRCQYANRTQLASSSGRKFQQRLLPVFLGVQFRV